MDSANTNGRSELHQEFAKSFDSLEFHDLNPDNLKTLDREAIRVTDPERCGDKEPYVSYTIITNVQKVTLIGIIL